MPHRLKNKVGDEFGSLEIIGPYERRGSNTYWNCKCSCGVTLFVYAGSLNSGRTQSCGCAIGMAPNRYVFKRVRKKKAMYIFSNMKQRCYDSKSRDYHNYGGRGISICAEWLNNTDTFYEWYDLHYIEDLTLDRRDNDGIYSPSNCRFVSRLVQANNRQRYKK